jgi:hypothetical protein
LISKILMAIFLVFQIAYFLSQVFSIILRGDGQMTTETTENNIRIDEGTIFDCRCGQKKNCQKKIDRFQIFL